MNNCQMTQVLVLNICACSSRTFIKKENIAKVAAAAEASGWTVNIVPDFCELAEGKDESVKELAKTAIVACHERAVSALLDFCDTECTTLLNIRTGNIGDELKKIDIDIDAIDQNTLDTLAEKYEQQLEAMPKKYGEDAWYPTLDKNACVECGKCFDFCPFGVYEMIDDRVRVVHPTHCKNNCPACARNCPASAIIFPKYDRSPINGGVEKEENAVQLDTKEIYTVALKERLAARRNRFLKK